MTELGFAELLGVLGWLLGVVTALVGRRLGPRPGTAAEPSERGPVSHAHIKPSPLGRAWR